MLSQQEISDRLEIQQLFVDYADAIDRRDWDALDRVFMPDAYIDYRAVGGIDGTYPEVKRWLAEALGSFRAYYHFIGNFSIRIEGDRASSRSICFNPMEMSLGEGQSQVMFYGIWYLDRLVRTADGWRLSERREQKCFDHNVPQILRDALPA